MDLEVVLSQTLIVRPLQYVGIILTYRCTCACRHCIYACSPGRDGAMDRALLRHIVSVLADLPFPPGIHLAGGEAFLVPDLLEEGTAAVRDAGLVMDFIETNAAWVRDEESAIQRLARLREAGCPRLLVSSTPFHAETIPPWRVDVALAAARRVLGGGGAWRDDLRVGR